MFFMFIGGIFGGIGFPYLFLRNTSKAERAQYSMPELFSLVFSFFMGITMGGTLGLILDLILEVILKTLGIKF